MTHDPILAPSQTIYWNGLDGSLPYTYESNPQKTLLLLTLGENVNATTESMYFGISIFCPRLIGKIEMLAFPLAVWEQTPQWSSLTKSNAPTPLVPGDQVRLNTEFVIPGNDPALLLSYHVMAMSLGKVMLPGDLFALCITLSASPAFSNVNPKTMFGLRLGHDNGWSRDAPFFYDPTIKSAPGSASQ